MDGHDRDDHDSMALPVNNGRYSYNNTIPSFLYKAFLILVYKKWRRDKERLEKQEEETCWGWILGLSS